MKTGKTLNELAAELTRQQESKHDFIADTRQLSFNTADSEAYSSVLTIEGAGIDGATDAFTVTTHAHKQLANKLGIPTKYYDRMRDELPELLDRNVNGWFQQQPERRMVRTLDGKARAFLSDRYRRIDNFDVAEVVLPTLQEIPDCQIVSSELTETRMYLKALTPRLRAEVTVGDEVQAGLVISNSEVGAGAVKIEPLLYRLVCLNGMIIADRAMRKFHVGRQIEDAGEDAFEIFATETIEADDKAFMLKVRDVVRAAFNEIDFQRAVNKLTESTQNKISGDPVKVVEALQVRVNLNDTERGSVLTHLIQGGDLSQYGLINAVTRASQDVSDYDRATEMERIGGNILVLERTQWQEIAEAA